MKANKQLLLAVATVFLSLTIINCGGGGSSSSPAATTPAAYGASCGSNMLQSQYGCLPSCGPSSVIYQNQCVPITNAGGYGGYPGSYPGGYPGGIGGQGGYGAQMCQGMCPPGLVSVQGGYACLQQGSCGACYGYYAGNCYIGDYAHQYYGY